LEIIDALLLEVEFKPLGLHWQEQMVSIGGGVVKSGYLLDSKRLFRLNCPEISLFEGARQTI
jgi:hypothetical protein